MSLRWCSKPGYPSRVSHEKSGRIIEAGPASVHRSHIGWSVGFVTVTVPFQRIPSKRHTSVTSWSYHIGSPAFRCINIRAEPLNCPPLPSSTSGVADKRHDSTRRPDEEMISICASSVYDQAFRHCESAICHGRVGESRITTGSVTSRAWNRSALNVAPTCAADEDQIVSTGVSSNPTCSSISQMPISPALSPEIQNFMPLTPMTLTVILCRP